MKLRVLVCGDRFWTNKRAIKRELKHLLKEVGGNPSDITLIEGACSGADLISAEMARELGILDIKEYPALWDLYGKAAGPIRNRQMLTEGKPDLVLAFHADIQNSRGTADMIKATISAGIEWVLYTK